MRKLGLDFLDEVPWGTHICQFYKTREDLLDVLVPYFKVGLENNEACLWVTSTPIDVESARTSLEAEVGSLDEYFERKQLGIIDYKEWYLSSGVLDPQRVLRRWDDKMKHVRDAGFAGLRAAGNICGAEGVQWEELLRYETEVNMAIDELRLIGICSYASDKLDMPEMIGVVNRHPYVLTRQNGRWEVVENTDRKRMEDALRTSERRYHNVVEQAPYAIVVHSEGKIRYANDGAARLVGAENPDELVGRDVIEFSPLEIRDIVLERMRKLLSGESDSVELIEEKIIRLDGEVIDVEVAATATSCGEGQAILVFLHDITGRKETERALRRSRESLAAAQRIGHMGNWDWDIAENRLIWSDEIYRIFGLTVGEFGATHEAFLNCVHPDDRAYVSTKIDEAQYSGQPYDIDHRIVQPGGSVRIVRERAEVTFGPDGEPLRMVGTVHDVTERRDSERRLREAHQMNEATLKALPDLMFEIDAEGRFYGYNASSPESLYVQPDMFIGRTVEEILPPEPARIIMDALREAVETGSHSGACYSMDLPGGVKWFELSIAAKGDRESPDARYVALARDITARREMEEKLRESEECLRRFVSSVTDVIYRYDPSLNRYDFISPSFAQQTGYSIEEIEADPSGFARRIIHPDDIAGVNAKVDEHIRLGEGAALVTTEYRVVRSDGRVIWVSDRKDIEFTEDGEVYRVNGVVRDISQKRRLEQMKDEFVSTVSHELRTPLTSIHAAIGLLVREMSGDFKSQFGELVEIANRNSARLVRLIDDLLDVQKIESGRMDFHFEPLALKPLVKQSIEDNRTFAEQFDVEFVLDDQMPEVQVHGDGGRLMQVMTNLLSNAAKYSPPDASVEISVIRSDEHVRVAVRDHGPGISEDFRDRIFQKFTQADSSVRREKGGTGLGLNIAKSIVERHGGSIGFETEMNIGTTFYFELPEWKESGNR